MKIISKSKPKYATKGKQDSDVKCMKEKLTLCCHGTYSLQTDSTGIPIVGGCSHRFKTAFSAENYTYHHSHYKRTKGYALVLYKEFNFHQKLESNII